MAEVSCTARLMQFVHYQNKRPNNSVEFWTAFVREYFALGAYMRIVLKGSSRSGHRNDQEHELRVLEAPFEVLPRLFHIKYDSGLKEELLYLSDPQERETRTGNWILSSHLAVEESVFETLRIKRYGRLCVLLNPHMKIMSYEFNMLGHDFSIPQPVILNQLGAMMQELQHRQQAMSQATPSKLQKPHEVLDLALNAIANMGHGLEAEAARLVEHGYVRRYMRSMQIADMVNNMHDLMQMSQHQPSPMLALQQFHMAVSNGQHPSPESLQSMPGVTQVQISPDLVQQQQPAHISQHCQDMEGTMNGVTH